jgi:hypothetical protein
MSRVPVPENYRDTLDRFTTILLRAPDFSKLPVKYPVTLDDMMASLDAGIVGVASRVKNPDAHVLFEQCREEVRATHQLYRENRIPDAKRRIQAAEKIFKQAAKLKSGKSDKRNDDLVEDDGQPDPPMPR